MFTGIVTGGLVANVKRKRGLLELEIKAPEVARELEAGASVAVNGVCLTARRAGRRRFSVEATNETIARTTLGDLSEGEAVNLELPVRAGGRLGGHIIQGHVDTTARLERAEHDGASRRMWFSGPGELDRYLVAKGSVALDGVSLTVVDVESNQARSAFGVMIVPHTLSVTTLGRLRPWQDVNVEVDVMAKYAEKLMQGLH